MAKSATKEKTKANGTKPEKSDRMTDIDPLAMLREQLEERRKNCMDEISKSLDKFGFMLDAQVVITRQGNDPQVILVPVQQGTR